jgi:hypothetical protein
MADSVLNYLDGYCERAGDAGAWGEPVNLITNLFFMVAAVAVAKALRQNPAMGRRTDIWLLAALMFIIGLGSGAWHLMPTQQTMLMDVVPIGLFINLYIISALRRLFSLSWLRVGGWWLAYTVAGVAAQKFIPPDTLNGTIMYVPTYLTLAIMTVTVWGRDRQVGEALLCALVIWTISLIFRTIDMTVCASLVFGTHFLWHTLNAWVLWKLTMVLVGHVSGKQAQ